MPVISHTSFPDFDWSTTIGPCERGRCRAWSHYPHMTQWKACCNDLIETIETHCREKYGGFECWVLPQLGWGVYLALNSQMAVKLSVLEQPHRYDMEPPSESDPQSPSATDDHESDASSQTVSDTASQSLSDTSTDRTRSDAAFQAARDAMLAEDSTVIIDGLSEDTTGLAFNEEDGDSDAVSRTSSDYTPWELHIDVAPGWQEDSTSQSGFTEVMKVRMEDVLLGLRMMVELGPPHSMYNRQFATAISFVCKLDFESDSIYQAVRSDDSIPIFSDAEAAMHDRLARLYRTA